MSNNTENWLKNIILAILLSIALIVIAIYLLDFYTRNGKSTLVPKITGMELGKAIELLEDSDLDYVILDSIWEDGKNRIEVLEQDPLPNSKVKYGRKIYLTVNTLNPPMVTVPELINKSSNFALVMLKNAGLKLGQVDTIDTELGTGLVLRQSYKGDSMIMNKKLPKGTRIDLIISRFYEQVDTSKIDEDDIPVNPDLEL